MCKMLELTVTCFACGMPSSSLWARKVRRSRHCGDQSLAPFYPQLEVKDCPPGAVVNEDGTVHLCAFCFALLDSTANGNVEGARGCGERNDGSTTNHWRFVCGVCGVETYRKRVRALPVQKFQFLAKTRKPGSTSITLGDSECAVVCLDCSETLWVQSDEYDRWGLPEHKRHFNWMARPPPPEDSDEANLARLPCGLSQLPRNPPTEPVLPIQVVEMEVIKNFRQYQKKDIIHRPNRSNSASSNSNSNSSGSNMPIDVENLQQPQAKKKRMLENEGSTPGRIMDQTLPHLESLDLSTRYSPPNSQRMNQTVRQPTLMAHSFPYSVQYPSTMIPLSRMAYPTYPAITTTTLAHGTSVRNTGPANYAQTTNDVPFPFAGSSVRIRSAPLTIRSGSPHDGHSYWSTTTMLRDAGPTRQRHEVAMEDDVVQIRYTTSMGRQAFQEQILHRPHFVYTAKPPPTMMREPEAYYRPFLSRSLTPITRGGSKTSLVKNQVKNLERGEVDYRGRRSSPSGTPAGDNNRPSTSNSTSNSRRFSVPVAAQSAMGGSEVKVALLPKKRRSWDYSNKEMKQVASVLKYAPPENLSSVAANLVIPQDTNTSKQF